MIKKILERIYSDFLLPSRLKEYENLLTKALDNNYKIISIEQFHEIIATNKSEIDHNLKYLILRHDIDTDVRTARKMFGVEKRLGVFSSFYFRLSTIDVGFMKEIDRYGSEASYHFEEIASYAKRNKIKDPEQIDLDMNEIQKQFSENLEKLRNATGISMEIVASHGDFVNRKLNITNLVILKDFKFRDKNNIKLEVYDDSFMRYVTSRHSDTGYPIFWIPYSPEKSIVEANSVIYILTHPRHWEANIKENIRDNCQRLCEGLKYKV